jgi:chromosome partitioning protein
MDHQGNLTSFFVDHPANDTDITDMLLHGTSVNVVITSTNFPGIDILPNYGKLEQEFISINNFAEREQTLKNRLGEMINLYDYILIDCPPALDEFVKNSLVASKYILIPIKADASGYYGLSRIFEKTSKLIDVYNPDLQILGIFAGDKENTRVHKQTMNLLRNDIANLVFDTEISHSKEIPQASFLKEPLIKCAKYSKPALEYNRLVDEILKKLI